MKNNKKKLIRLICIITIAICSIFLVINLLQTQADVPDGKEVLSAIEEYIPEPQAGIKEEKSSNEMPVFEYKDTDYVAILEIESNHVANLEVESDHSTTLGVESEDVKLPIIAHWDDKVANVAACRYNGDPYEGTLIIGGYGKDFSFATEINAGNEVIITDMHGRVFKYEVDSIKHLKEINEETLDLNNNDLALFTNNKEQSGYIVVYCTTIQ